jgi:hypothetical protein
MGSKSRSSHASSSRTNAASSTSDSTRQEAGLQPAGNQAVQDTLLNETGVEEEELLCEEGATQGEAENSQGGAAAPGDAPSDDELDGMVDQAQANAEGKAEDGEKEQGEGEGADVSLSGEDKGEGEGGGAGEQGGMAEMSLGSVPTGDAGTTWDMAKQAFPWDLELAQIDQFSGPEVQTSPVVSASEVEGAATAPDRGQLVMNALGQGAMSGLVEGGKAIAMDTAINMASSKIPMVAGFVEMGKLLWDPQGYAVNTLNGLTGGGKFGEAWTRFTSGDPIEMIAGLVDVVDGISSVIGTLSSICWLLAGLGFILSWIPGMQWLIPFVALAAQWGTLLGGIGTVFSVWASLARLVLVPLRSMDILFWADDEELTDKATALEAQTSSLTQSFTERAGDNLRGQMSERAGARRDGGAERSSAGGSDRSLMSRAGSVLSDGLFATSTGRSLRGENGTDLAKTVGATRDMMSAKGTTGRIDALENRGIDSTSAFSMQTGNRRERLEESRDTLQTGARSAASDYAKVRGDVDAHVERVQAGRAELDSQRQGAEFDDAWSSRRIDLERSHLDNIGKLETSQVDAVAAARKAHEEAQSANTSAQTPENRALVDQTRAVLADNEQGLDRTRRARAEAEATLRDNEVVLGEVCAR